MLVTTVTPVVTEIVADNTAPALSVDLDNDRITVSDDNLIGVMVNGELISKVNGTFVYDFEGSYFEVIALDKAGNTTTLVIESVM